MRGLTEYAQIVLNELNKLRSASRYLLGDAQRTNQKLGPDQQSKNTQYISLASRFLGCQQLTHSADLYNWYCREVLKLAVASNPTKVISMLETVKGPIKDNIARARKDGRMPGPEIIERFCKPSGVSEKTVRTAVHEHLGIFENPETDLLCICRNSLVHNMGKDVDGRMAESIQKIGNNRAIIYPTNWPAGHLPIHLTGGGDLVIDSEIGSWALDMITNQIHLMDQNFSALHNLPTTRWRPRPVSHCFM